MATAFKDRKRHETPLGDSHDTKISGHTITQTPDEKGGWSVKMDGTPYDNFGAAVRAADDNPVNPQSPPTSSSKVHKPRSSPET